MVQTDEERKKKNRDKRKKWLSNPENAKKARAYSQREDVKAKAKERKLKPGYIKKRKEYNQREERKAKQRERQLNPINIEKRRHTRDTNRLRILKHYSKQLSNSDIPCCRCCGENYHIDFLALDHIAGRKQMDSEEHLMKLDYKSSMHGIPLHNWIIENNFPKGFQILCQNCNFAKGMIRNKNKCPHEL